METVHRETRTHTHKYVQTKRNLRSVHLSTRFKRMANIAKSGLGRRWLWGLWVGMTAMSRH